MKKEKKVKCVNLVALCALSLFLFDVNVYAGSSPSKSLPLKQVSVSKQPAVLNSKASTSWLTSIKNFFVKPKQVKLSQGQQSLDGLDFVSDAQQDQNSMKSGAQANNSARGRVPVQNLGKVQAPSRVVSKSLADKDGQVLEQEPDPDMIDNPIEAPKLTVLPIWLMSNSKSIRLIKANAATPNVVANAVLQEALNAELQVSSVASDASWLTRAFDKATQVVSDMYGAVKGAGNFLVAKMQDLGRRLKLLNPKQRQEVGEEIEIAVINKNSDADIDLIAALQGKLDALEAQFAANNKDMQLMETQVAALNAKAAASNAENLRLQALLKAQPAGKAQGIQLNFEESASLPLESDELVPPKKALNDLFAARPAVNNLLQGNLKANLKKTSAVIAEDLDPLVVQASNYVKADPIAQLHIKANVRKKAEDQVIATIQKEVNAQFADQLPQLEEQFAEQNPEILARPDFKNIRQIEMVRIKGKMMQDRLQQQDALVLQAGQKALDEFDIRLKDMGIVGKAKIDVADARKLQVSQIKKSAADSKRKMIAGQVEAEFPPKIVDGVVDLLFENRNKGSIKQEDLVNDYLKKNPGADRAVVANVVNEVKLYYLENLSSVNSSGLKLDMRQKLTEKKYAAYQDKAADIAAASDLAMEQARVEQVALAQRKSVASMADYNKAVDARLFMTEPQRLKAEQKMNYDLTKNAATKGMSKQQLLDSLLKQSTSEGSAAAKTAWANEIVVLQESIAADAAQS